MDDHLIRKLRAAILKCLREDTIIRLCSKSPMIPLISVAFVRKDGFKVSVFGSPLLTYESINSFQ
jgi:hypothetical protein